MFMYMKNVFKRPFSYCLKGFVFIQYLTKLLSMPCKFCSLEFIKINILAATCCQQTLLGHPGEKAYKKYKFKVKKELA